jgi:hypothetical protein
MVWLYCKPQENGRVVPRYFEVIGKCHILTQSRRKIGTSISNPPILFSLLLSISQNESISSPMIHKTVAFSFYTESIAQIIYYADVSRNPEVDLHSTKLKLLLEPFPGLLNFRDEY